MKFFLSHFIYLRLRRVKHFINAPRTFYEVLLVWINVIIKNYLKIIFLLGGESKGVFRGVAL